jgi:hypothetical protein
MAVRTESLASAAEQLRQGSDPELISALRGSRSINQLRASAQAKQALMLRALRKHDVRAQITLTKRYLGLSDKAPPPPEPEPTYHHTLEQRKGLLERLLERHPHLLDHRK